MNATTLPQTTSKLHELTRRAQGNYVPKSPLDFIGANANKNGWGARAVALHIERIVKQSKAAGNTPIKLLINGQPGIGKTALALYLQSLLGCDKWSTTKLNGTQLKIDLLEELARNLHYTSLFSAYRLLHIDEADEIPRVAQVRFLSLLDDLPDGVAVVCTSNCKLEHFESRFQSRFQYFGVQPPVPNEIEMMLCDYVDQTNARTIATFACGNVRQALLDAVGVLQQIN
jgi:replication-associated recombination protein RarA